MCSGRTRCYICGRGTVIFNGGVVHRVVHGTSDRSCVFGTQRCLFSLRIGVSVVCKEIHAREGEARGGKRVLSGANVKRPIDGYECAKMDVLKAKQRLACAFDNYRPLSFVERRPFVSAGAAFLAGVLFGRPFSRKSAANQPLQQGLLYSVRPIINLLTALLPILISRASSSDG